jgi:hypothetical protein
VTEDATRSIRQSVLGADRALPLGVIPLSEARRRRKREGAAHAEAESPNQTEESSDDVADCPVKPLGHANGIFHFLDARGQHRALTGRELFSRAGLRSLFLGEEIWLRQAYPKKVAVEMTDERGDGGTAFRTVDYLVNAAAADLMDACAAAGIWGDHVTIRKPGVWPVPEDLPAVHCGDAVLIGTAWHDPGTRTGNQIWAAAAPTPRPGIPCSSAIGQELQNGLRDLWCWSEVGGPIAVVGLIGNAYYGAATEWRPAGFVTGATGAGKSALLRVMRAALPLHHYDNDTSKAGIEQAVHGRAMAIIIDEAADRANRTASRDLIDLVLSAAGDEGTKGSRGTTDGKGRRIEVAGLIIMFSINPPELEPQHLGRFTLIDLKKPTDGADHRIAHRDLAAFARKHAVDLWARALAGWDRYNVALEAFRRGLGNTGCAPREMDQAGALLAGWWVLTREGHPDERGVREGIAALDPDRTSGFIRRAEDVEAEDRPRCMLQHLLASMVYLHRSTDREPIGKLIEVAFGERGEPWQQGSATELLASYGIRVVRAGEETDHRGLPVPRMADGAGLWFSNTSPELRKLFADTPFEGNRWRHEMLRLPTARKSGQSVRFGGVSTWAIWIGRYEINNEKPP